MFSEFNVKKIPNFKITIIKLFFLGYPVYMIEKNPAWEVQLKVADKTVSFYYL